MRSAAYSQVLVKHPVAWAWMWKMEMEDTFNIDSIPKMKPATKGDPDPQKLVFGSSRSNDINTNGLSPLVPGNLNFTGDTWVTIKTMHRGKKRRFEGQVLDNRQSRMSESITIYNVVDLDTSQRLEGHYTFFKSEISLVAPKTDQEWPHDPKAFTFSPNEKMMDTVVVNNHKALRNFVKSLSESEEVTEIGCYMEVNRGRFDDCEYILMNVKNVLIVILVKHFGSCQDQLWMALGKDIFSNEKLLKVFFDCNAVTDYLYHQHSIQLRNTYDLKVVYANIIQNKSLEPLRNSVKLQPSRHRHKRRKEEQCELWELYLSNSVSLMDYAVMEDNIEKTFGDAVKRKKCSLKVKYLLLLKDEMQRAMLQPLQFLMESTSIDMDTNNANGEKILS